MNTKTEIVAKQIREKIKLLQNNSIIPDGKIRVYFIRYKRSNDMISIDPSVQFFSYEKRIEISKILKEKLKDIIEENKHINIFT
jgi:hypothetical protein